MSAKRKYELVPYDCEDGKCLIIHEKTRDSKIGALSLDHRSIGEAIVDELNELSEKLYVEQCRTTPMVLKFTEEKPTIEEIKEQLINQELLTFNKE